jgi:hypothetical protein
VLSAIVFWVLTAYVGFWVATVAAVATNVSLELVSVKLGWVSPKFAGD